jgi:hypothetical protein
MVKLPRPIQTLKQDIKEPMQRIAAIAVAAFVMAALALFISIGKGSHASA